MLVVHGTRAFRDPVGDPGAAEGDASTTLLRSWYATLLRWRRPGALFVSEATLLSVLVPLAPTRTLLDRFPAALADILSRLGVPPSVIDHECGQMAPAKVVPTSNRSVLGVMTEFAYLADMQREDATDLTALSMCGSPEIVEDFLCRVSVERGGLVVDR